MNFSFFKLKYLITILLITTEFLESTELEVSLNN